MKRRPTCNLTAREANHAASFIEGQLDVYGLDDGPSLRMLARAARKLRAFARALDEGKRPDSQPAGESPAPGGDE